MLVLQQTALTLLLSKLGKANVLGLDCFTIGLVRAVVAFFYIVSIHSLDSDITGEIAAAWRMLPPVVADRWMKGLNMGMQRFQVQLVGRLMSPSLVIGWS